MESWCFHCASFLPKLDVRNEEIGASPSRVKVDDATCMEHHGDGSIMLYYGPNTHKNDSISPKSHHLLVLSTSRWCTRNDHCI